MDELETEMANLNLYTHEIRKGFALVIVNEKFKYHRHRKGADKDKENIMNFCESARFTVNDINGLRLSQNETSVLKFNSYGKLVTDDLTEKQMKNLFKTISKGDFSSYDAFICFISSHGGGGGILGVDGETIPVQFIVDLFKPSDNNRTLVDKPKLFFTQNCRGDRIDRGVPIGPDDDGGSDESDNDVETDSEKVPITIPTEADILVAYSSVNGYESHRNTKTGSWFIIKLTKVLTKHARNMSLTDVLAIVNEAVARMVSRTGRKQMPCFTSTLRKAIYFKIVESRSSETHSSPQESEESHAAPEILPAASEKLPSASQESSSASQESSAASQESSAAPRGLPAAPRGLPAV
jgi:hypothetical protein